MKLNRRSCKVILVLAALVLVVVSFGGPVLAATEEHAGGDAAEGAAHGHEGAKIRDLMARTLNFVILAAAVVLLLRKPLKNFFGSRSKQIESEFSELKSRKDRVKSEFEELSKKLRQIEGEREQIVAGFVKEGELEKQKIIESARAMSKRIEEQAKLTINQEVKKAKEQLQDEIVELATRMAEDIVRSNIGPDDQKRLVNEYVEKVVKAA